tara:strand:+ start:235 stop:603 length:369 start_codon:yes stop_codon:yes gene_type:complete
MSEIFNAKEEIEKFISIKKSYQRGFVSENTYFSNKYNFMFSISFQKEEPKPYENTTYSFSLLNNTKNFNDLLNELHLSDEDSISRIKREFSKIILPTYIKLITRTLTNHSDSSRIKFRTQNK